MSSKSCCLRQHIRGNSANLHVIKLSLDDTVLQYLLCSPNLLGDHIEEDFEIFDPHDTRPESASSAILRQSYSLYRGVSELTMPSDTQNGFAFLEALTSDVSVQSLGRSFDGKSAHTGMKVRPSTSGNTPSSLQLLPGQSFYIGKTTLRLVPEEHSDLPITSSDLPDSIESYNYQVSQISTPQRTARVGSAIMETPIPHRDYRSENQTPIFERVAGQAISGRKDGKKWLESPLKRQVTRTVREPAEHCHSILQPGFKGESEHMADATIDDLGRSSLQPKVKTEDEDMANVTHTRFLKQGVVDREDAEMGEVVDVESNYFQQSEPLLPINSRVYPEEPSGSSRSSILEGSKPLSSLIARVGPVGEPGTSGQSPILQAVSHLTPQVDDDLDGSPVRKKAKTAAGSYVRLAEESRDSLQDRVVSVERVILAPTDHPVSTDQPSSTLPTDSRSRSTHRPKQMSPTRSIGSEHFGFATDSDPKPRPGNQLPSSFNSTRRSPRTLVSVPVSPSDSVEPNSSMRSTRSTAREEYNSSSSTNAGTRIVFASSSSAGDSKPFLKFLSSKGVKKAQSVQDCTVLCVGKELKKTSKMILAVLLGKDIITDSWVTNSVKANFLLSFVPYMARDPQKEADWGISLDKAIVRGKQGLKVFQDQRIHFTPSAKKELGKNGFDELKEIVKCAGAKSVFSTLPKKSPEETPFTLVVATHDHNEVAELQKLGWRAYVKDIISLSVLRGKLDWESDEFLIKEQQKESRKRKR